jgi:hypothetical protein
MKHLQANCNGDIDLLSQITSRIRYITDYIFYDYLLQDCVLTDSADEFKNS